MSASLSFRRMLPVVALALLGLARHAPAAEDTFHATGTTAPVSDDGRHFELSAEGRSSLGKFTGSVMGRYNNPVSVQFAVVTFDFGGGDTLTFDTKIKFDDETGVYVGTYVVTGGTGEFEGAAGRGSLIVNTAAGTFEWEGSLTF
jgi:hypothetical protein